MGLDLSGRAKRARERAKAAAGKAANQAGQARSAVSGAASDLRESGVGKVKELLGDFDSSVPVLRKLGYQLKEVSIRVGLPPGVVATFEFARDVSDEEVRAALQRHADHKLTTVLIRALSKARKFQSGVGVAGLAAQSTSVDIGLMPGVSVKFA